MGSAAVRSSSRLKRIWDATPVGGAGVEGFRSAGTTAFAALAADVSIAATSGARGISSAAGGGTEIGTGTVEAAIFGA
jgi:hypothetical protein